MRERGSKAAVCASATLKTPKPYSPNSILSAVAGVSVSTSIGLAVCPHRFQTRVPRPQ